MIEPGKQSVLGQAYDNYHGEEFTAEPGRVAVDEKQVQLAEGEKVWLYAAIDMDSKLVCIVLQETFAS